MDSLVEAGHEAGRDKEGGRSQRMTDVNQFGVAIHLQNVVDAGWHVKVPARSKICIYLNHNDERSYRYK